MVRSSNSDERVLVTGGNGAVGHFVIEQLTAMGIEIIVLSRSKFQSADPMVTPLAADIRDLDSILSAIRRFNVTRIIHLAAALLECDKDPLAGFEVNVRGTLMVLEAARLNPGIRRVVYSSSKSALGAFEGEWGYPVYKAVKEDHPRRPNTTYGTTKKVAEDVAQLYRSHYGVDVAIIRFGTTCGPWKHQSHRSTIITSTMIENAVDGVSTTIPQGGEERDDIVYNADIASGLVQAALRPTLEHSVYHLGSGQLVTLHDLADAIRTVVPGADIKIGAGLDYMGLGMGNYCLMDITRAKENLGFTPRPLIEWVSDYAARYGAFRNSKVRP